MVKSDDRNPHLSARQQYDLLFGDPIIWIGVVLLTVSLGLFAQMALAGELSLAKCLVATVVAVASLPSVKAMYKALKSVGG